MDIRAVSGTVDKVRERARKRQKTLASVLMCILALLIGYHVLSGNNGIKIYLKKRAENKSLQQEIDKLQHENDDLSQRVKALKTDPETIEKEAREQLKYAKPGEVIYVTPKQKHVPPPVNATARNSKR